MSSGNQILYNAPWHDLKTVCVGATYDPAFYEPIKNPHIRRSLQTIAQETLEDYDNLIKVLCSFNVEIRQIKIDPSITIIDYIDQQGRIGYFDSQSFTLIPRPPMQPRDSVLIVGKQAVLTNQESSWFSEFVDLASDQMLGSPRAFDAPLVTVVGDRLIADCRDHHWLGSFLQDTFPDRIIVPVMIGGHNDAVFSLVAPGVIVSTYHHTNYTETFPGWDVKYIENQSWDAVADWRTLKHGNRHRWWVPEDLDNPEFANFIDTWLINWAGFVAETVFDVNMLQIDQHHVLVNNYNDSLFEFLKKHKIEPIIVPFRHRFFWDGGLHCITNDLYRDGPNDCYF